MYRSNIEIHNVDCMEFMKDCYDNQFDLAIVDPPYGININHNMGRRSGDRHSGHKKVFWDSKIPSQEYFSELFRVSKNQIIWGGNYFNLPSSKCFIVWIKPQISFEMSFSSCEYAWASFDKTAKYLQLFQKEIRIHPTQKPVALYKWILSNYAKEGDKILDTHLGSGSIAIACDDLGYDLTACEIDKDYYTAALERIRPYRNQQKLFQ